MCWAYMYVHVFRCLLSDPCTTCSLRPWLCLLSGPKAWSPWPFPLDLYGEKPSFLGCSGYDTGIPYARQAITASPCCVPAFPPGLRCRCRLSLLLKLGKASGVGAEWGGRKDYGQQSWRHILRPHSPEPVQISSHLPSAWALQD